MSLSPFSSLSSLSPSAYESDDGTLLCFWSSSTCTFNASWLVTPKGVYSNNSSEQEMVLLEKLWEDMRAGPRHDRGLGKLRKISTKPLAARDVEGESSGSKLQGPTSLPVTPATPVTPTGLTTALKGDICRNAFNPWSNVATKSVVGDMFDKHQSNFPTIYDWLYSTETRGIHHRR